MPLPGHKPPDHAPRRRNKPIHEWTEIENRPYAGERPDLSRDRAWPARTLEWWEAISRMPHCVLWSESDWRFALDTAEVAATFHAGDVKAATELRQREKVMGTTVDYRRDLRIRYVEAEEDEGVGVTAIEDYRKRLQA